MAVKIVAIIRRDALEAVEGSPKHVGVPAGRRAVAWPRADRGDGPLGRGVGDTNVNGHLWHEFDRPPLSDATRFPGHG